MDAFLPKFDVLRQLLDDGALGEVRTVIADNGEHFGPEHRSGGRPGRWPTARPRHLSGGAGDDGTGPPEQVLASGQPAPSGVNGQASIVPSHAGNQSVLHTTLFSDTPCAAVVAGTEASATIPGPFYMPGDFRLAAHGGGQALDWREEAVRHGALYYQATHVATCVSGGLTESAVRPLAGSLTTIQVIDEVRRQLGIVFAEEAG